MTYTPITKNHPHDFVGGMYEPVDKKIYCADNTGMLVVSPIPSILISSNTTDAIKFDTTKEIRADLDNNIAEDIKLKWDSAKSIVTLTPQSESAIAQKPFERPAAFPLPDNTFIDRILSRTITFSNWPLSFGTFVDPNYFLLETYPCNYVLGEITLDSPTSWILRYQTWSVQGRLCECGGSGKSGSSSYLHARLASRPAAGLQSAVLASSDTSNYVLRLYQRESPIYGATSGKFPNIVKAEPLASPRAGTTIGQIAVYGDLFFVAEGDNVHILSVSDPTLDTYFVLPRGTLTNVTSLLVRRNPAVPREFFGQIQLIVADHSSMITNLSVLTADITDLSKPCMPTLTSITLKKQDGLPYTAPIGKLWDLTWTDSTQTAFYMPSPDNNQVLRLTISEDGKSATVEASYSGIPNPRTVLVASPTQLYIICKNEIGSLRLDPNFSSEYAVQGIGFVPFLTKIDDGSGKKTEVEVIDKSTGLANTSALPSWPLYVKDIPFGDTISLMINHLLGDDIGYYEVFFLDADGKTRYPVVDPFSDLHNGEQEYTRSQGSKYKIRNDPGKWYFPNLGAVIDTHKVLQGKSGLFELHVKFYRADDSSKEVTRRAFSHKIRIDNRRPTVKVHKPVLKFPPTTVINMDPECESLGPTDAMMYDLSVQCDFALDGGGFSYNIVTYKGPANSVKAMSEYGTTTAASLSVVKTAAASGVLGTCSAALIRIGASVSVPITNGYEATTHGAVQWQVFALYKKS